MSVNIEALRKASFKYEISGAKMDFKSGKWDMPWTKVEPKKEEKTFLGLKVGDGFDNIITKIRIGTNYDAYRAGFGELSREKTFFHDKFNVERQTLSEFIREDNPFGMKFVVKVNEDYALVVGLGFRGGRDEMMPNGAAVPQLTAYRNSTIDYFVMGKDDQDKIFIHWMEQDRADIIVNHSPRSLDYYSHYKQPWTREQEKIKQEYLHRNEYRFRFFDMDHIVGYMNREDQDFKRLQGDLVYKFVEGQKGKCEVHSGVIFERKRRVYDVNGKKMCERCIQTLAPAQDHRS